eukprot:CAMPEP_0177614932 /NCGR_PEP_ID=MMETSP0419_2-20121207/23074_1 /TAXON_ID=582737 /ORGANISM="Tetraselmis sp., Strain GSL018" /LENGTH=139 /DNA_ID=CAMNT_0019112333 /DNA_START=772 /DNA_END=1191 /DNA_ORIENTATION=-
MAKQPALLDFWEFIVLRALAAEAVKHHLKQSETLFDSLLVPEPEGWLQGAKSRDFTEYIPNQKSLLQRSLLWAFRAFQVFPPEGVRHKPGVFRPNPKSNLVDITLYTDSTSPESSDNAVDPSKGFEDSVQGMVELASPT